MSRTPSSSARPSGSGGLLDGDEGDLSDSFATGARRELLHNSTVRYDNDTRYMQVRKMTWQMLSVNASKYERVAEGWSSRVFEMVIVLLILANVALAIVSTEDSLQDSNGFINFYFLFELISALVFTAEYGVRLWACVERKNGTGRDRPFRTRLRWACLPLSMLDLIVLCTFYVDLSSFGTAALASVGILRMFRLLRILLVFMRLERQSKVRATVVGHCGRRKGWIQGLCGAARSGGRVCVCGCACVRARAGGG